MINIRLVMLPLDSGPVGLNDLAVGGHFACSLIIVAMFIRLGGGGGGGLKLSYGGQATKGWDHFYEGS